MNIGIVLRYYKKSKFGFIKTYNQSIFFHFSERKTYINRTDIVIFDIEKSERGLVAKNIRNIDSVEGLVEKLYSDSSNEKIKWLLLEKYPELYKREFKYYLEKESIEENTQKEFNSKLIEFNKYFNQFTSIDFWNNFKIGIGAKWNTLGGKDWTEAWWNYGLESQYELKKINLLQKIEDKYISNIIDYWEFILKVDWYTAKNENVRSRKELQFKKEHLEEIKNVIKRKFDYEYSKDEHFQSLRKYYPKMDIIDKKYSDNFNKLVFDNYNEYVMNNLKDNETIHPTIREIDEDYQMENL